MSKEKIKCICRVCGKDCTDSFLKKSMCAKHYEQFRKYGKCLDSNQRTIWDDNEIRIYDDHAEIDTYDHLGNVTETYLLDIEDVPLLSGYKWRSTYKGPKVDIPYLVTGHAGTQGSGQIYFHRLVMNTSEEIDHISRNTLNNRKSNLRKSYRTQQIVNTSIRSDNTSGMKGVYYVARDLGYKAEIQIENKRTSSKTFDMKEQAIYARIIMEMLYMDQHELYNRRDYMAECMSKYDISIYDEVKTYFTNRLQDSRLQQIYTDIDTKIIEYKNKTKEING